MADPFCKRFLLTPDKNMENMENMDIMDIITLTKDTDVMLVTFSVLLFLIFFVGNGNDKMIFAHFSRNSFY